MTKKTLTERIYRLHLDLVRKVNDTYIFAQQATPLLEEARQRYEASTTKEDKRYFVPTLSSKRNKAANRTDRELKEIYDRFIRRELFENLIVTAVSQFESYLFEVLSLIISEYPQKLTSNIKGVDTKREFPLELLLGADSRETALKQIISERLAAVSYAPPKAYLEYLHNIAGVETSDPAFSDYIEIKATRDLIVHNSSLINDVYVSKVGKTKRGEVGEKLAIDADYFDHCVATLKRLSGIIERDTKKTFK